MPVYVFDRERDGVMLPMVSKQARLVIWPGNGARSASMNHVVLEPGEANVPHAHPDSEDTFFILEGRGTVHDFDHDLIIPIEAGAVVHIPLGIPPAVQAG